jgi:hypothetical protein
MQLSGYALAKIDATGEAVNPDIMIDLYLKADGTYKTAPVRAVDAAKAVSDFKDAIDKWSK